jgi:ATP-dependent Clp protease protease subunit
MKKPGVFLVRPISLAILVSALSLLHPAAAQEDSEEHWDTLADAGNLAPHQAVLNALLEHRVIVLSHDVNANAVQQVVASLLLLDKRNPEEPIHLYVRSNGGWSRDVFAIISVMESVKAPVHTYVAGNAASAGAMILAAGTGVRTALPYATISIHDNIAGPEEDDEAYSENRIDRAKELAFWKRVAKLPEDWFKGGKDEMYHLDPQQALEFGLIDVIADPPTRN